MAFRDGYFGDQLPLVQDADALQARTEPVDRNPLPVDQDGLHRQTALLHILHAPRLILQTCLRLTLQVRVPLQVIGHHLKLDRLRGRFIELAFFVFDHQTELVVPVRVDIIPLKIATVPIDRVEHIQLVAFNTMNHLADVLVDNLQHPFMDKRGIIGKYPELNRLHKDAVEDADRVFKQSHVQPRLRFGVIQRHLHFLGKEDRILGGGNFRVLLDPEIGLHHQTGSDIHDDDLVRGEICSLRQRPLIHPEQMPARQQCRDIVTPLLIGDDYRPVLGDDAHVGHRFFGNNFILHRIIDRRVLDTVLVPVIEDFTDRGPQIKQRIQYDRDDFRGRIGILNTADMPRDRHVLIVPDHYPGSDDQLILQDLGLTHVHITDIKDHRPVATRIGYRDPVESHPILNVLKTGGNAVVNVGVRRVDHADVFDLDRIGDDVPDPRFALVGVLLDTQEVRGRVHRQIDLHNRSGDRKHLALRSGVNLSSGIECVQYGRKCITLRRDLQMEIVIDGQERIKPVGPGDDRIHISGVDVHTGNSRQPCGFINEQDLGPDDRCIPDRIEDHPERIG